MINTSFQIKLIDRCTMYYVLSKVYFFSVPLLPEPRQSRPSRGQMAQESLGYEEQYEDSYTDSAYPSNRYSEAVERRPAPQSRPRESVPSAREGWEVQGDRFSQLIIKVKVKNNC